MEKEGDRFLLHWDSSRFAKN